MPAENLRHRLHSAGKKLRADFEASANTKHGESRGTEREEILANFLKPYISRRVDIIHKAEIITSDGASSPACDLVIIDNTVPVLSDLRSNHIVPVESVYGVIEVKSDLTGPKLIEDCRKIRDVKLLRQGYPPIFGLLFGYKSIALKTLGQRFLRWCGEQPSWATDPDGVWVLDKGFLNWGMIGGANDNYLRADGPAREVRLATPFRDDPETTDVLLSFVLHLSALLATTQLPPFNMYDYLGKGAWFKLAGRWNSPERGWVEPS